MKDPGLDGAVLALSLSPPNDLEQLGYLRREVAGLTFELALQIIRWGGRVLYGGHLRSGGATELMFEHLAGAYASGAVGRSPDGPRPVLNLLSATELHKTPFARLVEILRDVQSFVEFRVVLAEGAWRRAFVRDDGEAGAPTLTLAAPDGTFDVLRDEAELAAFAAAHAAMPEADALTAMRAENAALAAARIVLGGRRGDLGVTGVEGSRDSPDRFAGTAPGIYEEILASLPHAPVAILAAYGGAAREAAFEVGLLGPEDPRAPYLGAEQDGVAAARTALRARWATLSPARRAEQEILAPFARRDDGPTLARDLIATLARILAERAG